MLITNVLDSLWRATQTALATTTGSLSNISTRRALTRPLIASSIRLHMVASHHVNDDSVANE